MSVSNCRISLAKAVSYTRKKITPSVKVTDGKKVLKKEQATHNLQLEAKVGIASITIKGKRRYSGVIKKIFQILHTKSAVFSAKKLDN